MPKPCGNTAIRKCLDHKERIGRTTARKACHSIKITLLHLDDTSRRAEHHVHRFARGRIRRRRRRSICVCAARIGGHPRTDGQWGIRHGTDDRMPRICRCDLRHRQSSHDGEHECAPPQIRSRFVHRRRSRSRLYCQHENINTGQKILCPDLCIHMIRLTKYITPRCLMLRYEDMGRRDCPLRCHSCDHRLCHRTAADDADLLFIAHALTYRSRKDILSPRRRSSSE